MCSCATGYVQAVALGVLDFEEFTGHAADIHRDQAAIAADAVVLMDDGRAFAQFAQVTDYGFRLTSGAAGATRLPGTFGKQLALGQHRQRRVAQREAVIERCDGDGEAGRIVGQEGRQAGDRGRAQIGCLQHFQQRFASAGRVGGDQHPARIILQEGFERLSGRCVLGSHGQRRQGLVAQRLRLGNTRVVGRPHFHARQLVELLAQAVWRLVDLFRRQQRPFDIVTTLFVAAEGLRPERIGGLGHAGAQHRHEAIGQVVEQRRGLLEEQRQQVFDARGQHPAFQILIQRAAAGIDIEALAQRGHHLGQAGLIHRHFAARQQLHCLHLVQRTL
jgi:hypothetical protein